MRGWMVGVGGRKVVKHQRKGKKAPSFPPALTTSLPDDSLTPGRDDLEGMVGSICGVLGLS